MTDQSDKPDKPYTPAPSYRSRARSGPREGDLRSVGELMNATLGKNRLGFGVQRARALLLWPQAAGPEVARLTRARSFQFGVLYVDARDSATAHHLSMQRHRFMARLNDLLRTSAQTEPGGRQEPGDEQVTEIRFGTGWQGEQRTGGAFPHAPTMPALDPAGRRKAAQLAQEAGGDLADVAQRAAEAALQARRWREQQGWLPCPVCGEPSPHKPCRACQLTLREPLVRRAANELMQFPDRIVGLEDRLGHSGEQAARFLAIENLEGQLYLLALECTQAGGAAQYRAFLKQQAHAVLALHGRKRVQEVTPADYPQLPEAARRVLTAGRPGG